MAERVKVYEEKKTRPILLWLLPLLLLIIALVVYLEMRHGVPQVPPAPSTTSTPQQR